MSGNSEQEALLRRLLDEQAIHRLVAASSHAVMRLDGVAASQVYTEDGVLSAFNGPEIRGREAIAAAFVATFAPIRSIVQTCAAGVIDITGDTARASWSVTELLHNKDKEHLSFCLGNYDDQLVRTADGWHFAYRRFNPFYRGSVETTARQYDITVPPHLYAPWPPG